MMGCPSLYYVGLFGLTVHCLAFPGPNPTDRAAIPPDAQSPRPTPPPGMHELLRRQNADITTRSVIIAPDNICGYFSGRPGAPLSCMGPDYQCYLLTSTAGMAGFAGCCGADGCEFPLDCLDYTDARATSLCDAGCQMDSFTLKCTQTARPYCNTVKFFGGITDYFCNSLPISSPQSVETTYLGQEGRAMSTTVMTFGEISTLPPDEPSTGPDPPPPSTTPTPPPPSSTGPDPPPESSTAPPDEPSSDTPVAPIVGGVVGGVAVIGLVILGVIFLVRKKPHAPPPSAVVPPPDSSLPPMAYNAPAPQMVVGRGVTSSSPPPPSDIKYTTQETTIPAAAYGGTIPSPQDNNNGYYQHQQLQYSRQSPQGAWQQQQQQQQQQTTPINNNTDPNRISMAAAPPPGSPVSSLNSQQQQPQGVAVYQHLSQQSIPGYQQFQPRTGAIYTLQAAAAPPPPQPLLPADVYEAGGDPVGGGPGQVLDHNVNHHGQIHQLQ